MNRRLVATACLLVAACSGADQAATCVATDGDTLRCGELRLRLNGIDAPELSEFRGKVSKLAMMDLLAAYSNEVSYVPLKTDRYGRTVAEVKIGPLDASCYMLATGNARYVPSWDEDFLVYRGCQL